VPEALRQERLERFMESQQRISREKLAERVGQRLTVLVDEVEDERVIARSYADAPEIDGIVIVPGPWDLEAGDFIEVEVTEAGNHDLWARPVAE
jgi:ribosomal protein S12 methylthiotransferase